MALTTLANVKEWLEIKDNTKDALLTRMIDSASTFIENWLNRKIAKATYTEFYDGKGGQALTLRNYPIVSLETVRVCGGLATILSQEDSRSSGVRFNERQIIINHGIFPRGFANVAVTYQAGLDEIPFDIEQACIDLVALRFKNGRGDRLGVSSKSLAGETVSFFTGDMSAASKAMLREYKNVVPV